MNLSACLLGVLHLSISAQTSHEDQGIESLVGGPLGRYRSTHPGLKRCRFGDHYPDQFEDCESRWIRAMRGPQGSQGPPGVRCVWRVCASLSFGYRREEKGCMSPSWSTTTMESLERVKSRTSPRARFSDNSPSSSASSASNQQFQLSTPSFSSIISSPCYSEQQPTAAKRLLSSPSLPRPPTFPSTSASTNKAAGLTRLGIPSLPQQTLCCLFVLVATLVSLSASKTTQLIIFKTPV